MKYFIKVGVLYDIERCANGKFDYPVFIKFTSEEIEEIHRKFIDAKMKGLAEKFRKICATNGCEEGYTIHELLQEAEHAKEVSEEIYRLYEEIPHWAPVQELGILLQDYLGHTGERETFDFDKFLKMLENHGYTREKETE